MLPSLKSRYRSIIRQSVMVPILFLLAAPALSETAVFPPSPVQQASGKALPASFEVASIKRNPHPSGWRLQFTPDGLMAEGVSLKEVIEEAYGIYNSDRILGGPDWVDTDRFDINAKMDSSVGRHLYDLTVDQRRRMLQSLLVTRFGLSLRHSTQERPILVIEVGKEGAHLRDTKPGEMYHNETTHSEGIVTRSSRGQLAVEGFSMDAFAQLLSTNLGTVVLNRTGLQGRYSFELHWTPEGPPNNSAAGVPEDPPELPIGTALERQLGLKLVQSRGPVDLLVIEAARLPSRD